MDGATVLGTGILTKGATKFSTSTLAPGVHTMTAVYGGDPSNAPGTSPALTQTVKEPTTVVVTSSVNPSDPKQAVTFTATVTPGKAGGNVQFNDGTAPLNTETLDGGVATTTVSTLTPGVHSITAIYQGDGTHATSTSPALPQTVRTPTSVAIQSSANPSNLGQVLILSATVTPKPTGGSVTFFDGGTVLGTQDITSGGASLTNTTLPLGVHSITAEFGGDPTNAPSTSPVFTQTVKNRSGVTLTSSPNPSNLGERVELIATVTPTEATGSVQFLDGKTALGTATMTGNTAKLVVPANAGVPGLAAGSHTLTASYLGDPTNGTATSPAVIQTVKANTTTSMKASAAIVISGSPVTLTAVVTPGSPTGNVSFMNGKAVLATVPMQRGGQAVSTLTLPRGNYSITAVYSGDPLNNGSSSSPAVTVSVEQIS